jgi:hypothetical protein
LFLLLIVPISDLCRRVSCLHRPSHPCILLVTVTGERHRLLSTSLWNCRHPSITSSLLSSNIPLSTPFLGTHNLYCQVERPSSIITLRKNWQKFGYVGVLCRTSPHKRWRAECWEEAFPVTDVFTSWRT